MTEQEFTKIRTLIIGLMGITEFKSTVERCDEALDILDRNKQLMLGGVSGSILMNILENNYELNRQFHEELREYIYKFCVVHYNETMTFENWLETYYR